jgi:hypothetical protein
MYLSVDQHRKLHWNQKVSSMRISRPSWKKGPNERGEELALRRLLDCKGMLFPSYERQADTKTSTCFRYL